MLFLERASMAGNAQPFFIQVNPRVCESPIMIKGFTFVKTFRVVDSGNHCDIVVQEDPLATIGHKAGSVGEVFVIGQELGLVHESTIIVRTDEGISHQPVQRLRIVMQLGLVPGIFQREQ